MKMNKQEMLGGNFEDIMGITVETGDEYLDKILNKNICYGGGSSAPPDKTTVSSGYPDEFKPYIERFLSDSEGSSNAGTLSHVQDLDAYQHAGLQNQANQAGLQNQLGRSGVDSYNRLNNLSGASDNPGYGRLNYLGSQQSTQDLNNEAIRTAQTALTGAGGVNDRAGQTGNLGGSRQSLAQGEIQAQLAGNLGWH